MNIVLSMLVSEKLSKQINSCSDNLS
uniref:Uncharacterized protein n=1 Tax=Arundo donax TaxID=35708 RepID=A0A0A8Y457_ARUDO